MNRPLPAQDLECPEPARCPVVVAQLTDLAAAGHLPMIRFPAGRHWFRVYDALDGFAVANPGFGDTRFAPFDDAASGRRVPTFYLAESLEAAMLESSLHDVHETRPRVVVEKTLLGKLHARVVAPRDLFLADLRDPTLHSLGIPRAGVASSAPEHYPCTRQVARAIHAGRPKPSLQEPAVDGIVWHSRQAEIAGTGPYEVVVVFADRVPNGRDDWTLAARRGASGSLLEGTGRLRLDELAETLDVTIAVSSELDAD